MTIPHDPDRENDWGGSTDWQRPAQEPGSAGPAWTTPHEAPPQQGYGGQGYVTPPGYGGPSPYQPAPPWPHHSGWPMAPPPNYLVQAVLVTLFCFLPTGAAAIYFSSQVANRHSGGDYAGALEASNKAKMWCWISLGIGVVVWLILIGSTGTDSGTSF
ncbi:CD225/dispanin family protein [Blastococcus saxobsidens]|uniref:Interferon-induced transmembrane protein n=1 Tax=Blastococcus saxobsidens (strain DD2) TaxID=1146883 RepID=H6RJW8_BLASD|nr:CD225/dispanin family protein [Blastococcus saxobsidens]CCG03621.1 Conserved protein of unknown function [Blastococcus saxobsidens DD2]